MDKEDLAEELHQFLHAKEKVETKATKIIRDKKQFSVRIPMKFALAVDLDPNKHMFKFKLILPRPNEDLPPQLTATLIKVIK